MRDRRDGLGELRRNPVMGLFLLLLIAGGTAVGFWIEPLVGWCCLGVFAVGLLFSLLRWLRRHWTDEE